MTTERSGGLAGPRGLYLTKPHQYSSEWQTASTLIDPRCIPLTEVVLKVKHYRKAFQRALPAYLLQTAVGAIVLIIILVHLFGPFGLFAGLGLGAIIRAAIFTHARRSSLYYVLSLQNIEVDDPSCVGDLIDIVQPRISIKSEHPDIQLWAKKLLIALLPVVSNADECGITQSRFNVLHKLLISGDRALSLAILKALEFVGNNTSKPYVAARMRRTVRGTIHDTEMLDQAVKVMTAIEDRQTQLEIKSTLLRGSSASGDANTMLRPVRSGQQHSESEQLLRAGANQEP